MRSCRIPNVSGGLIFVGRGGERVYQALYRKWRPRTFDEVVGQPHITETLKRQVATGRLSHAYLFTGTRGTGKTTCAKILARAVNCEHPVDGNPCNACPACLGIENGSILDVFRIGRRLQQRGRSDSARCGTRRPIRRRRCVSGSILWMRFTCCPQRHSMRC
ncbi:MAG: hypothetical protein ACLS43_00815 [Evtepia gabavorous]